MKAKIPFWLAVLINANIVIGSAFFINAGKVSALSGALAPFSWLLCGILLAPLVVVLAQLASAYPTAGGLYVYSSKLLGDGWGFASGWGYFVGTAAANGVVLHAFSSKFAQLHHVALFAQQYGLDSLHFDLFFLLLFTACNLMNLTFFERAQVFFTLLKAVPLLLIIIAVPFLGDVSHFDFSTARFDGLITTLPLVFFAYIGIEACCAIADQIENSKRNAARVIVTSFLLIMGIYTLLQLAVFLIHGPHDGQPFLSILPQLTSNPSIIYVGNSLVMTGLLASYLAGFYGMYYFNNWNLYAIAKERSIVLSDWLSQTNKHNIPWAAVLAQALFIGLFLLVGTENDGLISMGDLGTLIAYALSIVSFIVLKRSFVGYAALLSCSFLIMSAGQSLLVSGAVWYFLGVLGIGFLGHIFAKK